MMLAAMRVLPALLALSLIAQAAPDDWVRLRSVSEPQRPGFIEKRGLKKAAKQLPADQAEALLERTTYEIWLENTSSDKYCTAVRLEVRYLDGAGSETGRMSVDLAVDLKPHTPSVATLFCLDRVCRRSAALEVLSVEPTAVKSYEERWIEVNDRTWHVLDEWAELQRLTILPFSPGYYDNAGSDDRIFTQAGFSIDGDRTFRVVGTAIPASRPYPEHDIAWYSAAGLVVKDGVAEKPGFLKAPGRIINTNIHGELPVGQFVRVENSEVWGKKLLGLHLIPICRLTPEQRRLNSWLYFRFEPQVIKTEDTAAADAAIRPFLRPAPLSEVAETCGPESGRLVHRFTAESTEADLRNALGEPTSRRDVGGLVRLVYGAMEVRFRGGKLDEVHFGS